MNRRLAIADTVRFNSGQSKVCPFSSRAAPEVARPPRASMVGLLGAGLRSFGFHLQPQLDQAADGFGAVVAESHQAGGNLPQLDESF